MVHNHITLDKQEQEQVVWFSLPDMKRRVSHIFTPSITNPAPLVSATASPASPGHHHDSLAPCVQDPALVNHSAAPIIYYLALISSSMVLVIYPEVSSVDPPPPKSLVISGMLSGYGDDEDDGDKMDMGE
ncbi:hypothetical protein AcV5_009443 [Taiwanofungus camphoratus]|nr:hypothetical protein AcV5_009443 [Antrodia cinnamomea]